MREWAHVERFCLRQRRDPSLYTVDRLNERSGYTIQELLPTGWSEVEKPPGHHPWVDREHVRSLLVKANVPYNREMRSREARALLIYWAIESGVVSDEELRPLLELSEELLRS